MMEKNKVDVYMINQRCDVCKTGYMFYIGVSYNANGTSYEHRCNNEECKRTTTYPVVYPHPEYEYLE